MKVPEFVFNMDHFNIKIDPANEENEFDLRFHGLDEVFEFKAETREDAISWKIELKRHILDSDGFKLNRSAKGLVKPWMFDNISEN